MEEYYITIRADHEQEEVMRAFFPNNTSTFDQIGIAYAKKTVQV